VSSHSSLLDNYNTLLQRYNKLYNTHISLQYYTNILISYTTQISYYILTLICILTYFISHYLICYNALQTTTIIYHNIYNLLHILPNKSPLRRAILYFTTKYLTPHKITLLFNFKHNMIYKAIKEKGAILLNMKYKPNTKRHKIKHTEQITITDIINELLPVRSGRNWRTKTTTFKKLYTLYCEQSKLRQLKPRSNFFLRTRLRKLNIHNSKDDELCPHCFKFKQLQNKAPLSAQEQKQLKKCEEHERVRIQQSSTYLHLKTELANGHLPRTCLVIQDFTELEPQSEGYQDLIFVLYHHNSHNTGGLDCTYRHFIAPNDATKNDIRFVIAAWEQLLQEGWFTNTSTVHIWSDGGPKHFKITANMYYMSYLAERFVQLTFIYNFFESYHGHSTCDAAAAHAKKKINEYQRDNTTRLESSQATITIISELTSHQASILQTIDPTLSIQLPTATGIRSYHRYTFETRTRGRFTAHKHSGESKAYDITGVFPTIQ